MSPRLAVGDVSIASEGSAPCPHGNTMSPPNDGAFAPPGAGAGGLVFAVAPGAANTAAQTSTASKSRRLIEVVLPRRIHTTRSRCAAAEAGLCPAGSPCKHAVFRLTSQSPPWGDAAEAAAAPAGSTEGVAVRRARRVTIPAEWPRR